MQTVTSTVRGPLTTASALFSATSVQPGLLKGKGETLAPAEELTINFTVTFDPGLNKSGTSFNNLAVGSTVLPDGSPSGQRVSKAGAAGVPFVENHALVVTKNTPKSDVTRGEVVPYTITVRNDFDPRLIDIAVTDLMPPGFKYRVGSAAVQGVRTEPAIAGRQLTWKGIAVEKGKPITITLLLIVGGGAGEGEFTNEAWAGSVYGGILSNIAKATVRIVPDPTFDCTDIIGKVFDDTNRNGYQDEGERGIANVRVATVKGQLITTDKDGRFHIACADIPDSDRGSNFILKLDERTLPTGYRLTTENPRVIRITRGKMAKINFGASLHRVVRLDVADAAFEPGTTKLTQHSIDGLETVFTPLRQEPSILRLGYRRLIAEDLKLAQERIRTLQKLLLETWKRDGSGYELSIETEVYAEKSAAR